jgi:TolA-binding protein
MTTQAGEADTTHYENEDSSSTTTTTGSHSSTKAQLNKDQLDDILKSINDLSGRMQLMLEDMKQNKQDLEEIRKKKSELLKSI